jgi:hypothetical protein
LFGPKLQSCNHANTRGTLPDGLKIISSNENICKIQIGSLTEAQLGKWTCQIELEGIVFISFTGIV